MTGWLGDGEYERKFIAMSIADPNNQRSATRSPPHSIRFTYSFGPSRFGGIYWQNQPDNWGDRPGNNYSRSGYSKLTFWAKGATGGEAIEFKSGGINSRGKQYRDSFVATTGTVALTNQWRQFSINVSNEDLASTIGGFAWIASQDSNASKSITFFLDDIVLE